jgi:hypothetical protein
LAVQKLILLSVLLLFGCQDGMKTTPEAMRAHCAAAGKVRADRQMLIRNRQGGPGVGYNAAEAARVAEEECMKRLKQQEAPKKPAAK